MFCRISFVFIIGVLFPSLAIAGGMEELCDVVRKPSKPPTWGVEYVEGIDVHGKKVALADLSSSNILPDPLIIPIEIDLAQKFGLTLPADLQMIPEIFRINVFSDGRVTYNDQDVAPKIQKFCDEYHEENFAETPEAHGQNGVNAVPSDDTIEGQYPPFNE